MIFEKTIIAPDSDLCSSLAAPHPLRRHLRSHLLMLERFRFDIPNPWPEDLSASRFPLRVFFMEAQDGADPEVLPPPPPIPPNVTPAKADDDRVSPPKKSSKPKRVPMARPQGQTRKGQPISLLTNHFRVSVRNVDDYFYHYSVSLKYEDDRPVDGKGIGRRVIDKLHQTYDTELGNKDFCL
ncbi:hypothetical protein J5N97_013524 [Dioscorea zingiberensis]|uniref:Protein argonaute N-terminal domain-containing protein n=1 Tax=Dioscorea zingiberensis TaxID=325984 RepID=A0A9D5CQQ9_9LILI|nr:hypothetical protein J5N97_013524 [Dioscorea zingiberensis]